jgi:phage terminase large subunit-like protein
MDTVIWTCYVWLEEDSFKRVKNDRKYTNWENKGIYIK